MSFRGDDQRRYGHVPPVQYPVANQQQHQQQHQQQYQQQYAPPPPPQPQYDQSQYPARRPSFNSGDDNSYFDQGRPQQTPHQLHHAQPSIPSRGEDELFLTGLTDAPASAPPIPAKPAAYGGPSANPAAGMAGYQHQYQTQSSPSSYNPQAFARSQSQSLPYHHNPSTRLTSPTMPSFSSFQTQPPPPPQAQQQQQPQQQTYTPAAYNPAAYANAHAAVPQRTSTYAGYSSYQQHSYSAPAVPQVPPTTNSPYMQQQANAALYTPPAPVQPSPTPSAQAAYQPGSYYGGSTASAAGASPQPASYDQQQHSSNYSTSGNYITPAAAASSFSANGVSPMPSPGAIPATMTSQAPYPSYSQIPSGVDPNAFATRVSRSNSAVSPLPSPRIHSSSPAGLARHPTNAPLPSRPPMEDVQEEPGWQHGDTGGGGAPLGISANHDRVTQDSLIHDIEADLGISSGSNGGENGTLQIPTSGNGDVSDDDFYRHHHSRASSTHPSTSGWSSAASAVGRAPSSASTSSSNAYQANTAATAPSTYRWEDDSDPEGAFGVYEMQQADLDEQRFSISGASMTSGMSSATPSNYNYGGQHEQASSTRTSTPLPPPSEEPGASDSEFVGMDIGLFSGGYAGNLAYGGQVGSTAGRTGSSAGRTGSASAAHGDRPPQSTTPRPYEGDSQQYAPFLDAEMDYGGTGGLQPPALHRLSFDEGDEHVSVHSGLSGSESPTKEEYPDMFYHPGLSNRPLPALPPGLAEANARSSSSSSTNLLSATPSSASRLSYQQHGYSHSADSRSSTYISLQEQQQQLLLQQQYQQQLHVERSTSMSSHSTTPVVQVPGRSRTDAAEERRKIQRQVASQQGLPYDSSYDASSTTASLAYDVITLPSGRRKKFVPSKLTPNDFRRCHEPWALSNIAHWVREMADGEPDLKRKTIEEGLVALFTTKVPNMNVADAETLATNVADSMFTAGILIPEEEWVKFGPGEISGVLWQLTGSGCYAPFVHEHETPGRCYSFYCTRTLKKANLDEMMSEESTKKEDWVTFYKITKEIMEGKPKKEVERQNVLHEIVTSEEEFNNQLDVLRVLYKNQLRHWQPPIIPPNRLEKFITTVFGKVESMQRVNKDHLLAQLKYRQNEQGPWITGFSDIFREWIRKAKDEYIAYSTDYPNASFTVRKEATRNVLFRQFLEHVRNHKRSDRLGWDTFLKAPITRLQRYSLLLSTVLKNTVQDSEEKANLARAIDEIRLVTKDCDRLVDEMGKKVSLQELQNQLVFRPGSQTVLNLDHLGRELLLQGELQRMGSKGVRWVDTHALLFDHYFILAKAVSSKDASGGRSDKKYDVSKEPIPMPLLLLESMNDDPISKQKGLAAPLGRTPAASSSDIRGLNKVASNGGASAGGRPELEHAATSSSTSSAVTTRLTLTQSVTPGEEGKILYPFRVKHLGHEVYTLYATTPQSRQEWCSKIIEAKTRHARALLEQNAEPFRLRVMADSAFAYDSLTAMGKQPGVSIRGTPLDRSIREMEQVFGPGRGPPPVCRATVNCSTGFTAYGKSIIAIGTDFGVYISDASNPRGWTRTVQISKVAQIAVLEEFSVCLVLADKALISYPLDVVAPVSNFPVPTHDSGRRAPQRLAKDVSFFATARMKDRMLLFYKRKEGMHNTFKVLEPVFQKASEKKSRFFGSRKGGAGSGSGGGGSTESFRDFDEFYLPTECYSLNLFQTYVAVSTAKGIEMLTLDRKQTMSVPRDLAMPATANIAARLRDQRPLGMFRLNDQEFLLAYEDCAVYSDKHGEVSRTLIMEYSGKQKKARAATMFGQYLLLFNEDYVEVRNAENGRLRQIIAGHDVRCLDYGFRGPTGGDNASATATNPVTSGASGGSPAPPSGQDSKGTVKICMTHPEAGGMQIVLELLLNDGHAEKV